MLKLFVAIPCYNGMVNVHCMERVMETKELLKNNDIDMIFFSISIESLISRARNISSCKFLNSNCSHLLFIDSDIVFNPHDVLKLIKHNKDVISGTYPKKSLNIHSLRENIGASKTIQDLISRSVNYASNIELTNKETLIKCTDAPTGFMMIKRNVFLELIQKYPDIKYKNDISSYIPFEYLGHCYDFFEIS